MKKAHIISVTISLLLGALVLGAGCGSEPGTEMTVGPPTGDDPPGVCPAGADGLACTLDLYGEVVRTCDPDALRALEDSLAAREGTLPVWHDGIALFVSRGGPVDVAGEFN